MFVVSCFRMLRSIRMPFWISRFLPEARNFDFPPSIPITSVAGFFDDATSSTHSRTRLLDAEGGIMARGGRYARCAQWPTN